MEANDMHLSIEHKFKNKKIIIPANYVTVCKEASKTSSPFTVQYLDHQFFKTFDGHLFYNSNRSRRGVDARVAHIHA